MNTPLLPQEILLLERYSSATYFIELRDTWAAMLDHVETCFDRFMHNLPLDYRSRPLPEQPDIVWGERVLPNFRDTLQGLNDGVVLLGSGDMRGLTYCNGPLNDFKGQTEFWAGWMDRNDENRYGELLNQAVLMAANIQATEGAYWNPGDLTDAYVASARGPLNLPATSPSYRLSNKVQVASGAPLVVTGIYLPDVEDGCAQFLHVRYVTAPRAWTRPRAAAPDAEQRFDERDCLWTLVERDDTTAVRLAPSLVDVALLRVAGGQPCPQSGAWFTPAQADSRRHFKKGDIMPSFDSAYGVTIWQWDANQR